MIDLYKINVVFKNKTAIIIEAETDKDPKENLSEQWPYYKKIGALPIGDYIFDINEIWYIKVESDTKKKKVESDTEKKTEVKTS